MFDGSSLALFLLAAWVLLITPGPARIQYALKGILDAHQISALDIDSGRRGETLTLEEFAALGNAAAHR